MVRQVKIPAASGGALEGRSLLCWGNLSPKPPNKDAIPPHRKQWGILASFRKEDIIIADTSGLVSLFLPNDQNHEVAVQAARHLQSAHKDILIPADVFV